MRSTIRVVSILLAAAFFAVGAHAQIDEICREVGILPSLDSPFAHVPYVYGRIALKGFDSGAKPPGVVVIYTDNQRPPRRLIVSKSGNYCFSRSGSGGTLTIEVDGLEAARRALPSMGPPQQREDFEISSDTSKAPPGVISTKFSRPLNEKTVDLYKKAAEAERSKDLKAAIFFVKQIVEIDPSDFVAWSAFGALHLAQESYADAEGALRRSLEMRVDYTPAWINVGKLRVAQKQFEAAIEIFKHAASLEPSSAKIYRLLGEAYLQSKKGSLAVPAFDEAIRLNPIGMAECHLLKARLYDLAGAKHFAASEYKIFLQKVPDHPERRKLEKYIKEHLNK